MSLDDDEIVDVEIVIVLGIGDRRFQAFAHVAGDALARKLEIRERGRHLLAADELGQKIELLRADAEHAGHRLGLGVGERALALFLAHDKTSPRLTTCRRQALPARRPVPHPTRRLARWRVWPYGLTSGRR